MNLQIKVNSDDLIYRYKGNTADSKFDNAFSLLDKIRDGKISLADAKNDPAKFKSNLNEIEKETTNIDEKKTRNVLYNIEMLYKARNSVLLSFLMIILQ